MKKKLLIVSGVLAITIALGVGIFQSNASEASPKLNHEEISQLISSQYPGTITELELEKDDNRAVYEVEIVNDGVEYELKVDGNSGEILKLKEKRIAQKELAKNDNQEKISVKEQNEKEEKVTESKNDLKTKVESKEAKKQNTVIDKDEALEIALAEFPGEVDSIELDEEDGRLIYEIEIESGDEEAEFEIDAMTGEIIVIEIDD